MKKTALIICMLMALAGCGDDTEARIQVAAKQAVTETLLTKCRQDLITMDSKYVDGRIASRLGYADFGEFADNLLAAHEEFKVIAAGWSGEPGLAACNQERDDVSFLRTLR